MSLLKLPIYVLLLAFFALSVHAVDKTTVLPQMEELIPSSACAKYLIKNLSSNPNVPKLQHDITEAAAWSFGDFKTHLEPRGAAIPQDPASLNTLELVGKVRTRAEMAIVHVKITRTDEETAIAEIYATSENGENVGQKIVIKSGLVMGHSGKVWRGWNRMFSGVFLDGNGSPRQVSLSIGWEQEAQRPNAEPRIGAALGSVDLSGL